MEKVRVVVYGVGRVGGAAIRIMANRKWIELAGAIDSDKSKVGRDLGEVAGLGRKLGITVSDDPQAVFRHARARVVIHTTSLLHPEETETQIIQSLEAGLNVISTTDARLFFPWVHYPQWGKRVDELAKKKGVVYLETGLCPGLESDLIPIVYSGACGSVKKIKIKAEGQIYRYSPLLLAYLGFGMSVEEFERGLAEGTIHATALLRWSPQVDMISDALGWKLDDVTRKVEPIIAKEKITLPSGYEIQPGRVCGFRSIHSGIKNKEAVIIREWAVRLGADEGYKFETRLEGDPDIVVSSSGFKADICTAAHAINHIPQVLAAKPGLVTVRELPVAAAME